MKLMTNLLFHGECREAFERYAEVLGGEITSMFPFASAPGNGGVEEARRDWIMHSWLQIGDQALMGCDSPSAERRQMGGFTVTLRVDDAAEAERVFRALEEGGTVSMPFGRQFWSPACGMLTDRFGTPWLILTED